MKKILIVETNTDHYLTKPERETGIWLKELTSFYGIVKEAGYDVDFASPKGGSVPIDPISMKADEETLSTYENEEFKKAALESTKKISELKAEDYEAIYFVGGHGVIWDFPEDTDLQSMAQKIYANGGYITSVCHGVAALINLKDEDGEYLVKGKKINGFTNEEEALNGTDGLMPYLSETELLNHGADFVTGKAFTEYAVEDQRFITGQNPFSGHKVAQMLVEALRR